MIQFELFTAHLCNSANKLKGISFFWTSFNSGFRKVVKKLGYRKINFSSYVLVWVAWRGVSENFQYLNGFK